MLIAARNAMMVGGGWKNPYITDGLVAMWDGEWNAGGGKHETSPQKWIDISGNGYDLTPTNNIAFGPNSVAISGKTFVGDASVGGKFSVLEAVFASSNGGEGQRVIFFPGSPSYIKEGLYVNRGRLSFNQFPTGYFVAFSSTGIMSVSAHGMPTPSSVLLNGSAASITTNNAAWSGEGKITIGSRPQNDLWFNGTLYTLRLYNREFTADEIAANYAVDKVRFNLP